MVASVKPKPVSGSGIRAGIKTGVSELVAFCPKCKNLQPLWFTDDQMVQTRKFTQRRGEIYHDCGSEKPCRLYRFS